MSSDNDEWLEITSRISHGDTDQFERYYIEFVDIMLREAKHFSGFDEHRCMDVVHDAMLKVIQCMKPVTNRSKLTAWTRTVVRSVVYDAVRKDLATRDRERRHKQSIDPANEIESFEKRARLQWIKQELEAMEPDLRHLFDLRYRLGWSLKKIACHVGLKTGAVDGRIRRTIIKLQSEAEDMHDG